MRRLLWAIMRKEVLLALREGKLQILASIVLPTIMQWALLGKSISESTISHNQGVITNQGPTITLMYVPLLLVPFLANSLLLKSFVQEKFSGALMCILATGINVGVLWGIITASIFLYCFFISIIILEVDILMMVFVFKVPVILNVTTVVLTMVVAPIVALTMTAILSFTYWIMRFNAFVATFLPLISAMAIYYYGLSNPTNAVLFKGVIAAFILAGLVLFVCGYTITKLSRSYILRL